MLVTAIPFRNSSATFSSLRSKMCVRLMPFSALRRVARDLLGHPEGRSLRCTPRDRVRSCRRELPGRSPVTPFGERTGHRLGFFPKDHCMRRLLRNRITRDALRERARETCGELGQAVSVMVRQNALRATVVSAYHFRQDNGDRVRTALVLESLGRWPMAPKVFVVNYVVRMNPAPED